MAWLCRPYRCASFGVDLERPRDATPGGSSRCSCSSGCRRSSSTRRGRRSRATTTTYGPYLSPFYSPEILRGVPAQLVRTEAGVVAGLAAVLAGAADPADSGGCSDSPATTIAAPTTRRSGPIRRRAPSASRVDATGARTRFRSSCRTSIATCCSFRWDSRRSSLIDVWKAFWFTDPATGAASFGIGVGTLVLAANIVLLGGYLFGCHSLRHVVGGCVDQLSRAPLGLRALRLRELPQSASHALGLDEPVRRRLRRPVRPALLDGRLVGLSDPLELSARQLSAAKLTADS